MIQVGRSPGSAAPAPSRLCRPIRPDRVANAAIVDNADDFGSVCAKRKWMIWPPYEWPATIVGPIWRGQHLAQGGQRRPASRPSSENWGAVTFVAVGLQALDHASPSLTPSAHPTVNQARYSVKGVHVNLTSFFWSSSATFEI